MNLKSYEDAILDCEIDRIRELTLLAQGDDDLDDDEKVALATFAFEEKHRRLRMGLM